MSLYAGQNIRSVALPLGFSSLRFEALLAEADVKGDHAATEGSGESSDDDNHGN